MNKDKLSNMLRSIDVVQELSLNINGIYDIEKSIIWMVEEVGELVGAIRKDKNYIEVKGELGDLLSWIFSIANILNISASEALMMTYIKEIQRQKKEYGKCKNITNTKLKSILE